MTTEDRDDAAAQRTASMTEKAPERLWLSFIGDGYVLHKTPCGTEYIRADLAAPKAVNAELVDVIDILAGVAERTRMKGQEYSWGVIRYIDEPATSDLAAQAIRAVKPEEIIAELQRRAALARAASDERETR